MTAIVKGHGTSIDDEEVFLPDGVTVRMYTAEGVNLNTTIALMAMLDEAGDPGETITGTIRNYLLETQDDAFVAKWYALAKDAGAPIWWVGVDIPDGTRLCEDPNRGTDEPMCAAQGEHVCTGVLGLVRDDDIALVTCRGRQDDPNPPSTHTPTRYDAAQQWLHALADEHIRRLESGDPAKVAAVEADIDGTDQHVTGLLMNRVYLANWMRTRWVAAYAASNDLAQMFGQLESNVDEIDGIAGWLNRIPSYGRALDTVAETYPETFTQWMEQTSEPVRAALTRRPAIRRLLVADLEERIDLRRVQRMMRIPGE